MSVDPIVAYLQAAVAEKKTSVKRQPQPFVTLSREAGVGGPGLAGLIAERLSRAEGREWRVLDRELCELVAADPELASAVGRLAREAYLGNLEESISRLILDAPPQAAVLHKTFRIVRAAAVAGRVVIVGRAGNLITRDLPLGAHLRVVMPRLQRVANIEREHGLSRREADRECERLDLARRRLVKDYFRRDIDDPFLYDAIFNAGRLSAETIADLAARLLSIHEHASLF